MKKRVFTVPSDEGAKYLYCGSLFGLLLDGLGLQTNFKNASKQGRLEIKPKTIQRFKKGEFLKDRKSVGVLIEFISKTLIEGDWLGKEEDPSELCTSVLSNMFW